MKSTNATDVLTRKHDIRDIARRHGATHVKLFGSFAQGSATESSDVDILVELAAGRTLLDLVAIKQDLEEFLGRPVHVVTAEALSPYLREDVLEKAVAL